MINEKTSDFDAIVVGAGVSGLYQLHRLRELGLSARVYETGGDVGGTWYWNRYPGARFDSESYTYGYSFSQELLQEWSWSEHFAPQPETLRYLNLVADTFDLRRDIQFNSRVTAATYDEPSNTWEVELEGGGHATCRFLVLAIGGLSVPRMPAIEGRETFEGQSFHTFEWPHEPVELAGKRVAVIGTGATAVQLIPEVAKDSAQLTVFQRRPNWCAPLNNGPITPEEMERIKATYDEIFANCDQNFGGFVHKPQDKMAFEVSDEEREATYERLYGEPGFGIWMGNYRDIVITEAANKTISDFIAKKIRERVHDPATAEKLIPTDHGFGTRRLPLETNYYETYNRDNVRLVDVRETPFKRITPTGIETTEETFEFDIIIYATGFDAITGAFNRMDIRGEGGVSLADKWAGGPKTYLGIQFAGFPNLFATTGPHNATIFSNMPRAIEVNVDWVTALIEHMLEHGYTRVEPREDAEEAWTEHVYQLSTFFLFSKVNSWFTGYNSNVEGPQTPRIMGYIGGLPNYRERIAQVASAGYEGFELK